MGWGGTDPIKSEGAEFKSPPGAHGLTGLLPFPHAHSSGVTQLMAARIGHTGQKCRLRSTH